ncbi:MAG: outer membrane lipoprotein-sorting protein [Candidatus Margulisbacteria bacterium]|nr:outer membrane lipoprotein-sorting protein [Candidatus Margulisiibacteriota bacterium]
MKKIILLISILVFSTACFAEQLTGQDIMTKVDERIIPIDMSTEMSMDLINKRGQVRQRSVKTLRQGDEKMIMWFLAPADVKDSSFLRIENPDDTEDMWLYLPAFNKVRRIVSSARKENFMGSDFTYEDMSTRKLNDYTYNLLVDEKFGEYDCYVVESTPQETVDTSYGKIKSWIWKDDFLPVKEEYYDRLGYLKKVKVLSEIKKIKAYWIPFKMTMEDLQKEHKTELSFKNIKVDTNIPAEYFHTRYLTRKVPQ